MQAVEVQDRQIPALGLGTWQLVGAGCREAVRHALELGYRHIDTARAYGNEEDVGAGLADSGVERAEVFLTTKLWRSELDPERVAPAVEDSLRRLGTDYVDLLLIHWPGGDMDLGATLEAMLGERDAGRVCHVGVSNFPPSLVREAVRHAPLLANQVEYHPYLSQEALLELADRHDHALVAYCPIAQGEVNRDAVLTEIGRRHGKSPVQVALRWLVQQPRVAAIPRASSAEHRGENLEVFDFELDDDEMKQVAALDRGRRLIDPGFVSDWER